MPLAMLVCLLLYWAPTLVNAASFDCAKSSTAQEKLICGNPELSALDTQLADLYRLQLSKAVSKSELRSQQLTWLKAERSKCRDESCLIAAYRKRIFELNDSIQQTAPQPAALDLLAGAWEPLSNAMQSLNRLTLNQGTLKIGACSPIRYQVIVDQPGYGHGPDGKYGDHVWRQFAVELMPGDAVSPGCLQYRVFEFSIPTDKPDSVELALFGTRADFEKKDADPAAWGVWVR